MLFKPKNLVRYFPIDVALTFYQGLIRRCAVKLVPYKHHGFVIYIVIMAKHSKTYRCIKIIWGHIVCYVGNMMDAACLTK